MDDNTYWNNNGKYQALYDALRPELVPAEGHAPTHAGEVLRCIGAMYHDHYNNGGGNWDNLQDRYGYLLYYDEALNIAKEMQEIKSLNDMVFFDEQREHTKPEFSRLSVLWERVADKCILYAKDAVNRAGGLVRELQL